MRLINVETYGLTEFWGGRIPRYAILTHTWGDGEVTHQEWLSWLATGSSEVEAKQGFQKVMGACRQAKKDRLDWLWVDTNCIDKTSSAELSEAINSMYAWYRGSSLCYCYMADVPMTSTNDDTLLKSFKESRWHTRGWTLQELLAARRTVFYSQSWTFIGTRDTLSSWISAVTGIQESYLVEGTGQDRVRFADVSMKMSWIARRDTTRVEDIAYYMLGIFEVNMPLLYSEGIKAFTRLQEEILQSTNDHTIFCWAWDETVPVGWASILAPSPRVFKDSAKYRSFRYSAFHHYSSSTTPFSMTNMGLSITLPLIYTHGGAYAVLDAFLDADPGHKKYMCICLQSSHLSSAVFSRSISVRKPLEIDTESLGDLRRYNIMVPYKTGYTRDAHSSEGKIGLILILKETATQFFSAQPESSNTSCFHSNQPLVTNLKQYYTSPIFLFDSRNGLLTLSPPQHCDSIDHLHTALMYIETKSEGQHGQSEAYYLFFGAMMKEGSVTWYCDMTTRSQLTKQKLTQLMMSQADLEEHFRKKAMVELGSMRQSTHATSEDLQIDIGSSVYLSPGMVTRTAILSGPSPGSRTRRRRHEAVWKFLSSFRMPIGSSPTSAANWGK